MSQTAIGKAALVLTADAKGAKAGLATASSDIKKWADGTVKQLRGQFQEGFTGGFLGGVFGANFSGIAQEIGKLFGRLADWLDGVGKIKERVGETERFLKGIEASMGRSAKLADEWLGAMVAPADRLTAIDRELAELEDTRKGLKADRDSVRRDLMKSLEGGIGGAGEAMAAAKERAAKFDESLKKVSDRVRDLTEKRDRLLDPRTDPLLIGDINKATAALQDQILTWGLVGDAVERARFKDRGATDEMIAGFERAAAEVKRLTDSQTHPWLNQLVNVLDTVLPAALQESPPWLGFALQAADKILDASDKLKTAPILTDNAALQKGSSAEVSFRTRFEMGSQLKDQLAEAKKANVIAKQLLDAIKELPALIQPALIAM